MEEKKSRHTPGPWDKAPWSDEFQSVRIFAGARIVGFSANSDMTREEIESNAEIMLCAPEMLEALEEIVSIIKIIDSQEGLGIAKKAWAELHTCETVIKKARGME